MNEAAGPRSRLEACAPEPDGQWALPDELAEVSGLAWEGPAALAHGDELGRIYRVTPAGGAVIAAALTGEPADDFEGIALTPDRVVLSTSSGRLYVVAWPPRGSLAPHRVVETRFGRECELEGLAWDNATGTLLLPCKEGKDRGRRSGIAIRRRALDSAAPLDDVRVSDSALRAAGLSRFRPSAIEVDRGTGHWILLSARPAALLEITPTGAVVAARTLDRRHRQPEGLTLTPEGDLLIADEAAGEQAELTRYRCDLP